MDGKRIAMSESGVEDMAGIGNSQSREDDMNMFQNELLRLESLVIQNDRKSLFTLLTIHPHYLLIKINYSYNNRILVCCKFNNQLNNKVVLK